MSNVHGTITRPRVMVLHVFILPRPLCSKPISGQPCMHLFLTKFMALMVAQAVERWHSVWAGQVWIPGRTWAFLVQNCSLSILAGHQAFFKICALEQGIILRFLSCFQSSFTIVNICQLYYKNAPSRGKNPQEAGKAHFLKKIQNKILMLLCSQSRIG